MRELKVYLRRDRVEAVMLALREAGVPHMTVTHVRSFGSGVDPKHKRISLEAATWYTQKAKLEFVCPEADVDVLVPIIEMNARTRGPGDGIILVSPVDRAIKIRTGVEGKEALA